MRNKNSQFTRQNFPPKISGGQATNNFQKRGGGFTLIELLVVIAIISMLSSIVLASVNSARIKAKDTQKNLIMVEYRKAINQYYSDNGRYPDPGNTSNYCLGRSVCNGNRVESAQLNAALSTYLPSLTPLDNVVVSNTNQVWNGPLYRCFNHFPTPYANGTVNEVIYSIDIDGDVVTGGREVTCNGQFASLEWHLEQRPASCGPGVVTGTDFFVTWRITIIESFNYVIANIFNVYGTHCVMYFN